MFAYSDKECHTNFHLLTKSGHFSIVQSTTSGATPLVLCPYHYTKTYLVPVVLI